MFSENGVSVFLRWWFRSGQGHTKNDDDDNDRNDFVWDWKGEWCLGVSETVSRSRCSDPDLNLNPSPPHSDVHHIQNEETYLYHDDDDQGASQLGKCKRNFNISFLEDNNNNINSNNNNNKIDRTMLQCYQGWELRIQKGPETNWTKNKPKLMSNSRSHW